MSQPHALCPCFSPGFFPWGQGPWRVAEESDSQCWPKGAGAGDLGHSALSGLGQLPCRCGAHVLGDQVRA